MFWDVYCVFLLPAHKEREMEVLIIQYFIKILL